MPDQVGGWQKNKTGGGRGLDIFLVAITACKACVDQYIPANISLLMKGFEMRTRHPARPPDTKYQSIYGRK